MKSAMAPLVGIDNPPLMLNRNEPSVFSLRVFSKMPDSITYQWNISWKYPDNNLNNQTEIILG